MNVLLNAVERQLGPRFGDAADADIEPTERDLHGGIATAEFVLRVNRKALQELLRHHERRAKEINKLLTRLPTPATHRKKS